MKKQIYCFNNGGSPGWYTAIAMAEDGNVLASHICSSEAFMAHDLGLTSDWKHDQYDAHYGAGNWELVWITDVLGDERLNKAYALNQIIAAEAKEV